MENWKHQLTATTLPMAMPRSFAGQMPGSAMPQFNLLEPWRFWFQKAGMWQRTWLSEFPRRCAAKLLKSVRSTPSSLRRRLR
jgi:hypothetical protein